MRYISGPGEKDNGQGHQDNDRQGAENTKKPAAQLGDDLKAGVGPDLIQLQDVNNGPQEN